jgi:hypothetical protein
MFSCAYCKSSIEEDSFYCDQCGKEIMLCEKCGQPGSGPFCENDGEPIIPAQTRPGKESSITVPTQPLANDNLLRNQQVSDSLPPYPEKQVPATEGPSLTLINDSLQMKLTISPGMILGARTGPYASQLSQFKTISGKHLQFIFDPQQGWKITDLGSTNGTKYSAQSGKWEGVAKLPPQQTLAVQDAAFLLIANIEFRIEIEDPALTGKTQRI